MGDETEVDVQDLEVKSIIGFDGGSNNGFIIHHDKQHVVYALGNKVVIQNWSTKKQTFLTGHTNIISTVAVSVSGKYLASGQINYIGFKASVIIWDYHKQSIISEYESHQVRVEAVTFSKCDSYVISLGGRDCNSVIIWDIKGNHAVCISKVAKGVEGFANVLLRMNRRGTAFITGGDNHLTVWTIHEKERNLSSINVMMMKLKRNIYCIDANERDEFCFCGTSTGDLIKVRLFFHHDLDILEPTKQPQIVGCYARLTKKKLPRGCVDLYHKGIRSIKVLFNPSAQMIIGAGDGTLELVEEYLGKRPELDPGVKMPSVPGLKIVKSTHLNNTVTSIQLMDDQTILAATTGSEIYLIKMDDFNAALVVTCHTACIHDVSFPYNFSEVFATAGEEDVRIWSMTTMQELLRIRVQNFTCSSVAFTRDGKSILTAWNDGTIKSFTPLTGRLIYVILNAHNKGVTTLAVASHGKFIVSGGCEGQVRLWQVSPYRQTLVCTLKEHKGPISAICINKFDTEAVSASSDGSCIIWDLERQRRRQILFAKTMFMTVKYFPSCVQVVTGGSDRKIGYWETLDGTLVREIEGSSSGTVNALDISPDGELIGSGGNDQMVKLWDYQEGVTTHVGLGHSAVITTVAFSPDGKYFISCDSAGCTFIWKVPKTQKTHHMKEEEKAPPSPVPELKLDEVKEEDIKDLPSVRSSESVRSECKCKIGGDCKCCKCQKASSTRKSECSSRSNRSVCGPDPVSKECNEAKVSSKCSSRSSTKGSGRSECCPCSPVKEEPKTQQMKCECKCHCAAEAGKISSSRSNKSQASNKTH